jgi:hypothetical protein
LRAFNFSNFEMLKAVSCALRRMEYTKDIPETPGPDLAQETLAERPQTAQLVDAMKLAYRTAFALFRGGTYFHVNKITNGSHFCHSG